MMIQAVTPTGVSSGSSAGLTAPAAAVSMQVRTVLSNIATAPGLTETERTNLVRVVAQADQALGAGPSLDQVLEQVQGLGLFLRSTGDQGLPRWSVMTSLRVYGLNLDPGASAPRPDPAAQAAAVSAARQQLQTVAAGRGVSLEQAVNVARQVVVQAPAPVQPAPRVEKREVKAVEEPTRVEKVV